MIAIDTNVLVYAIDPDESVKQPIASDLIDQLTLSIPPCILLWQVAGEFLSCLRKLESAKGISPSDVEENMSDVLTMFPLVIPTKTVIEISLDLSNKYSLSHWDSMLLAACIDAGVDTLYTEDMDAGTTFNSLTLVNPFA